MQTVLKTLTLSIALFVGAFGQPWFPYGVPFDGGSTSAVCDSACQSNIGTGEGVLYKPNQSSIVSLPNGSVGQVLQSRGPGLPPEFTNPSEISAFVYGPGDSLVSNPVLANPLAKFVRVTDTTRVTSGSDYATDPTLIEGSSRFVEIRAWRGVHKYDSIASGTTSQLNAIAYSPTLNLYAVVGVGGLIRTSTTGDAGTWTARTSGTAQNINGVTWDGTRFIAVGNGGVITWSADGITWTAFTVGGLTYTSVIKAGSLYVATGFDNGTRYCIGDPTVSGNWLSPSVGSNGSYYAAATDGTTIVMVGVGGAIRSTTDGVTWVVRTSGTANDLLSIVYLPPTYSAGAWAAAGATGTIVRTTSITTNFSVVASGTTENLRIFDINEWISVVGTNGVSLTSNNGGVSFFPGAAIGTTNTIRFGTDDGPPTSIRALFVGNAGNLRAAQYPFLATAYVDSLDRAARINSLGSVQNAYSNLPATVTITGEVSFDLDTLTPASAPINVDVLRQFKSSAYASTAARAAGTPVLGSSLYSYSSTPLVVTIPSQMTFQIGILTPADVPFDFDVVTIDDVIYNLFVVQNSSLNPGPYYGFNAVYDFGVDDRFEFGAESDNEYATLMIQDSDTGDWFVKKSTAAGDAGDPITWVDAFVIRGNGRVDIEDLNVNSSPSSGTGTMGLGTASPCASGTLVWIPVMNMGTGGFVPWCPAP